MRLWLFPLILFSLLFITACEESNNEQEPITQDDTNQNETVQEEQEENTLEEENDSMEELEEEQEDEVNKHIAEVEDDTGLHVVDNPESNQVYLNKQRKLPDGYEPADLVVPNVQHYAAEGDPKRQMREEAAKALESLFTRAQEQGIELIAVSGYRSYDRQKQIYDNSVATNGQEYADKYSASPGTSEHQTGLAMDIGSSTETVATLLEESFKQTSEGTWLAENAHQEGFIIRYPEGKSEITGYNYEPWHIRYVGKEIATEIHDQDLTLEEYFGYDY
ncbi:MULTISPECIES: D-alanyl-D-alanine carboxypeptidase family protein [Paraliobacillus]|uniref:M15 family metallopeptidase n=1 Tax=Paraliobacillus TaxID=200903 RepID=UPI000E3E4164|nr:MULTISPECIES: M15 family metallopeptidase [Paraliobacillus]